MFSQTVEYALRAVVWIAAHAEEAPIGVSRIAEGTQVPRSYLSKVLQGLARAGLVESRAGVKGGHSLTRPPEEITVLAVVDAVDPLERITACPLGLKSHAKRRCGMHARLDAAIAQVQEALGASTIADVLNTPRRPKPMEE